jgi:uncharacterized protein (DUF2147 family)
MRKIMNAVILLLLWQMPVYAANPEDILGVWNTEHNDAKVEIFKCGEKYCGKIVWLKDPNYPPNSKEGTPGTPKIDHNNPDPALRARPVMGLQFMSNFRYAGDNVWKDGRLYDPEKGKTYSGKMTVVSHNQLDLRGFVGISLLGRTSKWTR